MLCFSFLCGLGWFSLGLWSRCGTWGYGRWGCSMWDMEDGVWRSGVWRSTRVVMSSASVDSSCSKCECPVFGTAITAVATTHGSGSAAWKWKWSEGRKLISSRFQAPRRSAVDEGDGAFVGERFDGVYQLPCCDVRSYIVTEMWIFKLNLVFVIHSAHDIAIAKQHKSIAATDVLRALELLDFGDLVEPLTQELALYKDSSANKSTKSKSGSKGLSISIPPQASISSASTSVSSNPKITLTVRPSANGQDKGKAKASNVDRDGDEEMRGADEEDEGDESRMNSPVGGGRDGDESRVASEEREGLQEMDPPPPTSPSVAASVGDGANPS
ncbi:hypothetical protein CC2G_004570 [Coprinopsis cinerea AmutBmut pab1-1]|nr:hypothetical protein CC2G_004570 [Coprinopsis cinerea AmutBmut pab1-1]